MIMSSKMTIPDDWSLHHLISFSSCIWLSKERENLYTMEIMRKAKVYTTSSLHNSLHREHLHLNSVLELSPW